MMTLTSISYNTIYFTVQFLSVFIRRVCKAVRQYLAIERNKGYCHSRCITIGRRAIFGIVFLLP